VGVRGGGELRNRFVGYVLIGGGADVQTQHRGRGEFMKIGYGFYCVQGV